MSPLTGVLTEAWDYYRRYAGHFLTISFVIYLIAGGIEAVLSTFASAAGIALARLIGFIALFLVEVTLVKAVQDVRDGRVDLDFGQTVRAALPYLLPVVGASILAAIGVVIGLVLLIIPGLILLTFWALIVPCIVIGESGVLASFGASWRTVRGYAWRVFGTYVLVFLIEIAFAIVLALILLPTPAPVREFVATIVADTLIAPFLALVVALIYYRLTAAHAQPTGGLAGGPYQPPPGYGPPGGGYQPPGGYPPSPGPAGGGSAPPPPPPPESGPTAPLTPPGGVTPPPGGTGPPPGGPRPEDQGPP